MYLPVAKYVSVCPHETKYLSEIIVCGLSNLKKKKHYKVSIYVERNVSVS